MSRPGWPGPTLRDVLAGGSEPLCHYRIINTLHVTFTTENSPVKFEFSDFDALYNIHKDETQPPMRDLSKERRQLWKALYHHDYRGDYSVRITREDMDYIRRSMDDCRRGLAEATDANGDPDQVLRNRALLFDLMFNHPYPRAAWDNVERIDVEVGGGMSYTAATWNRDIIDTMLKDVKQVTERNGTMSAPGQLSTQERRRLAKLLVWHDLEEVDQNDTVKTADFQAVNATLATYREVTYGGSPDKRHLFNLIFNEPLP